MVANERNRRIIVGFLCEKTICWQVVCDKNAEDVLNVEMNQSRNVKMMSNNVFMTGNKSTTIADSDVEETRSSSTETQTWIRNVDVCMFINV